MIRERIWTEVRTTMYGVARSARPFIMHGILELQFYEVLLTLSCIDSRSLEEIVLPFD